MMKNIASRIFGTGDSENKILKRIATPDGAKAFYEEVTAILNEFSRFPDVLLKVEGMRVCERKLKQLGIVLTRFKIAEEMARISAELAGRSKSVNADIAEKVRALDSAKIALDSAKQRQDSFQSRLIAQEKELEAKLEKALVEEREAQVDFDKVLLDGVDDAQEAAAAVKLAATKVVVSVLQSKDGPLSLRIDALRREIESINVVVDGKKRVALEAEMDHLDALATKERLKYDQSVFQAAVDWNAAESAMHVVNDFRQANFAADDAWIVSRKFRLEFDGFLDAPLGEVAMTGLGSVVANGHPTYQHDWTKAPNLAILAAPLPEASA